MRRTLVALLAVLALSGLAQAQTGAPEEAVNQTVQDTHSTLDKVLDGVGDAAKGVGHAAEETGRGVGKATSSVGKAIAAAAKAVGQAALAAGRLLGDAGQAAAKGVAALGLAASLVLAQAVLSAADACAGGLALLGASASGGLALLGAAAGSALAAAGAAVGAVASLYAGLVAGMRPEAMPVAAFGAAVATGGAASAGVGGWAGWSALKKWGLVASGGAGVAGFSRIDDSELLEHPLRSQIFQVIQQNPGIHASGLARQVGAGWGTITHHLEKLEKGHLVATRKVNNQKCFFENGGTVSRHDMAIAGAVKGDTASDIAGYVLGHPMTSQKDMAASLGISPALVSFHVKKLINLGVLEKVRHGKETLLTTTEALRRVITADKSAAAHVEMKDESFQYSS